MRAALGSCADPRSLSASALSRAHHLNVFSVLAALTHASTLSTLPRRPSRFGNPENRIAVVIRMTLWAVRHPEFAVSTLLNTILLVVLWSAPPEVLRVAAPLHVAGMAGIFPPPESQPVMQLVHLPVQDSRFSAVAALAIAI